jgi:hypothetical protein
MSREGRRGAATQLTVAAPPAEQAGGPAPPAGFALPRVGPGVILLADGQPKAVPTCYAGSVRIRALKEGPDFGVPLPGPGKAPGEKDETTVVWLEVRPEPKVQIQFIESAAIGKAEDDKGQKLEKAAPPAPAAPGGAPGAGPAAVAIPIPIGMFPSAGGAFYHQVTLKKGEKAAGALKELAGTIAAQVVGPPEPLITVNKITKAAGETAKGKDGGQIKVTEVKEGEGKITVTFELETPRGVRPAGEGSPVLVPGIGPDGPPRRGIGPPLVVRAPGIALLDEKGQALEQTGGAPPKFQVVPGQAPVMEFTQEYKLEKDQKAAKLVFSGSRAVGLDVPFTLKDVPLK